MAPFLQILARTSPLSLGFIGNAPIPPHDPSMPGGPPPNSPEAIHPGQGPTPPELGHGVSEYTLYGGSGAVQEGWPEIERWVSFDDMWSANLPMIQISCSSANLAQENNSPADISAVHDAITLVSSTTDVDSRLILAVIMQESKGCVRVRTTSSPGAAVRNPGIMQSHNGEGSCADRSECSSSMVKQMVRDGTAGTPSGDGLQQCLAAAHGNSAEKVYRAARIYNSGSIAPSGLLGAGVATHCYASDIANRLMGWTDAPSKCFLDDR